MYIEIFNFFFFRILNYRINIENSIKNFNYLIMKLYSKISLIISVNISVFKIFNLYRSLIISKIIFMCYKFFIVIIINPIII